MRKINLALRLLGVCAFLVILIFYIDIGEVVDVMKKADPGLLVFAFFLLMPLYGIKALRWKRILSIQNIAYSHLNSLLAYLSSNLMAFITPGRLGEIVKAVYIKQDTGVELARALPGVIWDRVFDVYFLTWVAALGMMRLAIFSKLGFWGYVILAVIVAAPLLFLNASVRMLCLKILKGEKKLAKWGGKLDALFSEFDLFKLRNLLLPFAQTAVAYGIMFWASLMIAHASGIQVSFVTISFFVSIANILSFIPISIAGLGTRDASFIYLFSTIGRGNEEAMAFSLLFFFVFFIGGGLLGLIAYAIKPVKIRISKPIENNGA